MATAAVGAAQAGVDMATQITGFVQQQQALAAEQAQQNEDENNIRCAFVDNTLALIGKAAPKMGYLLVQDTNADDDSGLVNRVLPMNNAEVAIGQARTATYRVYVFESGTYVHNQGFGKGYWGYGGSYTRKNDTVKHGLHKDPKATLTWTKVN